MSNSVKLYMIAQQGLSTDRPNDQTLMKLNLPWYLICDLFSSPRRFEDVRQDIFHHMGHPSAVERYGIQMNLTAFNTITINQMSIYGALCKRSDQVFVPVTSMLIALLEEHITTMSRSLLIHEHDPAAIAARRAATTRRLLPCVHA